MSHAEALSDAHDKQAKLDHTVDQLEKMLSNVGQSLKAVTNGNKKEISKITVIKLLARIENDLQVVRDGLTGQEDKPLAMPAEVLSDPRVRG